MVTTFASKVNKSARTNQILDDDEDANYESLTNQLSKINDQVYDDIIYNKSKVEQTILKKILNIYLNKK